MDDNSGIEDISKEMLDHFVGTPAWAVRKAQLKCEAVGIFAGVKLSDEELEFRLICHPASLLGLMTIAEELKQLQKPKKVFHGGF